MNPFDDEPISLLLEQFYRSPNTFENDKKEILFSKVKEALKHQPGYKVFSNKFNREAILSLEGWLFENKRFEDIKWLITRFIDDPDPPEPSDSNKDELRPHYEVMSGEIKILYITSVLGKLAWAIQKLAANKEYIVDALSFTQKLAKHKNAYVKLSSLIPLMEISSRRQNLEGYGTRPYRSKYEEFHKLVFSYLDFLKTTKAEVFSEYLIGVFSSYKDLNTIDALKVLDTLCINEKAAGLFLYYGEYRKNHYQDMSIDFDPDIFNKKLFELIKSDDASNDKIRRTLAWNLWVTIKGQPSEFDRLKIYIDSFFNQKFNKNIYDILDYIIDDNIDRHFDDCSIWFIKFINRVKESLSPSNDPYPLRNLWITKAPNFLKTIAEKNPSIFLTTVRDLVYFWQLGAYIGEINQLFEFSKNLPDKKIKDDMKKIYSSMQEMHPRLPEIKWD